MIRSVLKLFAVGVIVGIAVMATGSFFTVSPTLAADSAAAFQVLVQEESSGFSFSVPGLYVRSMRVEIMSLDGSQVFDSGWLADRTVNWPKLTRTSQAVASGVYLYTVSVRDKNGREFRKFGKLARMYSPKPELSVPRISDLAPVVPAASVSKWKELLGKGADNWRILRNSQILLELDSAGGLGLGLGLGSCTTRLCVVSSDTTTRPGEFDILNPQNNQIALFVYTNGNGRAGFFRIDQAGNGLPALESQTNGDGPAIFGFTNGSGSAGDFENANSENQESTLRVITNAPAPAVDVFGGGGPAGEFHINSGKNSASALIVDTGGTGGAADFRNSSSANPTIYVQNLSGKAAQFLGDVAITGNLTKFGGSFKIDHPLDPANKYLYHSFVESPDMKNIYDGVVTLDERGEAVVQLPRWFEALNKDFRYQLTAIGAPGPNLYIAEEIKSNKFKIAGGKPGMKVSWQLTGIRQDPYANDHRIQVEEQKPEAERGYYLYPQGYGQPANMSIACAQHTMSTPQCKQEQAVK